MSTVHLWFLDAGYATHPERMVIDGGALAPMRFTATVAVIEHPRDGVILLDTGFSERFHDVTRRLPERLHTYVMPVTMRPEDSAAYQLRQAGIAASDVRTVVLSHFHPDHVAGVADFPRASYVFQRAAYERLRDRGRLGQLRAGFLPGLLPDDFEPRARPVDPADAIRGLAWDPARAGWDLCGDGSVVLVDLPGHAIGHSGLYVQAADGHRYLLAGDACWLSRSFRERRMPGPAARLIVDDWGRYTATIDDLHAISLRDPALRIVPCHCGEAHRDLPRQRPALDSR